MARTTFRGVEWETSYFIPIFETDTPGDELGAVGFGSNVALGNIQEIADELTDLNHLLGIDVIIEAVELEGEVYVRPKLEESPLKPGALVVFKGYDDSLPGDLIVGEVGTLVTPKEYDVDSDYPFVAEFVGLDNAPFGNYLLAASEIELAPEGTVPGDVLAEVE